MKIVKLAVERCSLLLLMAVLATQPSVSQVAYAQEVSDELAESSEVSEQTEESKISEETANASGDDEAVAGPAEVENTEDEQTEVSEDETDLSAKPSSGGSDALEGDAATSSEAATLGDAAGIEVSETEFASTTLDEITFNASSTQSDHIQTATSGLATYHDASSTPNTSSSTTSLATSTASTTYDRATTTISSGQSVAMANILNLVNSNFVNSEGVVLFSNFFDTVFGAIDLREYFSNAVAYGCSLLSCQGQHIAVNMDQNATIENDITLSAVSGNNAIDGASSGVINTGDAYAGLNLINVANTNLVDSNYLLVTLNAFQDVNGDVVFPSLSQFFGSLAGGASSLEDVSVHNSAQVNNDVHVDADSGGNNVSSQDGSSIETGDAYGATNVFNELNASLVGGQSVAIVFRVHGSWAGEIFGAPDNLAWTAGDDGSIYLFDVGKGTHSGSLSMEGTSTASINNKVSVVALTGNNAITNAETAVISTGNAYAGANIINVANANVIGRNWILAVINIFGDFNGDIAFGRPDLWVGGMIDVPRSIKNGSVLEYKYTIINNGDSEATNVEFSTDLNGDYLDIQNATAGYEQKEDTSISWQLGDIPPAGAVELYFTAVVKNTAYGTDIVNTSRVQSRQTDNNEADNTETLTISTDQKKKDEGVRIELRNEVQADVQEEETDAYVPLDVVRQTQHSFVHIGSPTAPQELVVTNDTNRTAYDVVLHDILKNNEGIVVRDEVWELGDVLPHEKITLAYDITFNPGAQPGEYTLDTVFESVNAHATFSRNGRVTYGSVQQPSLAVDAHPLTSAAFGGDAERGGIDDVVYHADETPLIPNVLPFETQIANAANTSTQLAAAITSGVPFLDPVMLFFIAVSTFLAFSLLRMFRMKA